MNNYFVPPLLRDVLINDNIYEKPLHEHEFAKHIMHLPCHMQAVERTVKLVSEVSKTVCGKEKRTGQILTVLQGSSNMNKFETKRQYSFDEEISSKIAV